MRIRTGALLASLALVLCASVATLGNGPLNHPPVFEEDPSASTGFAARTEVVEFTCDGQRLALGLSRLVNYLIGDDFAVFQACHTGLNGGLLSDPAYCVCMNQDRDSDVDQADLLAFEACASGPDVAPDLGCDD